MEIDPVYAHLPGIAHDQPDVFETNELPESEQATALETLDADGESVEKIDVTASQAFERFKGTHVEGKEIDFSDKVSRSRRTGYDIPRSEYEIVPAGTVETVEQKYSRLQHELRELAEEVSKGAESSSTSTASDQPTPVVLAKQVEYLQGQLTELKLDSVLGTSASPNSLADPQAALHKRLLTEIDGFKGPDGGESSAVSPKGKGAATPGDSRHVTYQLYYRPEQAKFSNNARMADLEERIERMEALLGNNPEKLSALTADTSNKSLVSAVSILSAKSKLLEPGQVDQMEGRLLAVNQKLTQLIEKKEAVENTDKLNKVGELYGIVKKWDSLADTLPTIVERLTALKDLHEQALQFSQALTQLDSSQQQIIQHITAHKDMLQAVNGTLSDNLGTIKTNCENLDIRMKALKK